MARNYAKCHPNRIVHGNGLCGACYQSKWINSSKKNKKQRHKRYLDQLSSGRANDANWRYKLKTNFNMTIEQFENMLDSQNYVCAICKEPETRPDVRTGKPRRLSIDHCHKTNKIRGLLCCRCNRTLGWFQDNIQLFHSAIIYLEKK